MHLKTNSDDDADALRVVAPVDDNDNVYTCILCADNIRLLSIVQGN